MSRISLYLLAFLLCATLGVARADWSVRESSAHPGRTELVTRYALEVEEGGGGAMARLQLAVFDPKEATLRVIDQPTEPRRSLAATIAGGSFLAAVNGGYFDPEHEPIGLLIADGRVVRRQQKARLLSGVLSAGPGGVLIARAAAFSPKTKPDAARQCGPFLVEHGRIVVGLNETRAARRTFALVTKDGRAALGYSSSVTLAELAEILANAGVPRGMKVESALNLDGGSSSAFWFAGRKGVFSRPESKTVRDFIAIVPRS